MSMSKTNLAKIRLYQTVLGLVEQAVHREVESHSEARGYILVGPL